VWWDIIVIITVIAVESIANAEAAAGSPAKQHSRSVYFTPKDI